MHVRALHQMPVTRLYGRRSTCADRWNDHVNGLYLELVDKQILYDDSGRDFSSPVP
jgi:hypothetical protein